MFRGPSFIVSTMQEETTPIFKRLWYDWTQQQPGIEPTNPLGQCWVPPIVAFYDQQGLLRTYSLPGSSIRSPHPGSPRGQADRTKGLPKQECERTTQAAFHVGPGLAPVGQSWAPNGPRMGLTGARLGMLLGYHLSSLVRGLCTRIHSRAACPQRLL